LIDEIDLRILAILQTNGRAHLADIAREVSLSSPAVMERVRKLEARGVIKGYHAIIDPKKIGKEVTAFIGVSMAHQRHIDEFAGCVMRQADVLECHHVTGEESFILKVKTTSTESLERLLAEIRSVEGVTGTVTRVVLSSIKESQKLEFDPALHRSARRKVAKAV
jgi:Lrp/AsnC family leucine-responsive transcriptional regulator